MHFPPTRGYLVLEDVDAQVVDVPAVEVRAAGRRDPRAAGPGLAPCGSDPRSVDRDRAWISSSAAQCPCHEGDDIADVAPVKMLNALGADIANTRSVSSSALRCLLCIRRISPKRNVDLCGTSRTVCERLRLLHALKDEANDEAAPRGEPASLTTPGLRVTGQSGGQSGWLRRLAPRGRATAPRRPE